MSDVEIVIKIPDDLLDRINKADSIPDIEGIDIVSSINCIRNGKPLPKGHGKIVDANRVLENGDNWEVETALRQTETIIEADEVESEVTE